ncbi:MAG: hypothetical protein ACXACK_14540 [Candidatus Hodarchaeales archaeon]
MPSIRESFQRGQLRSKQWKRQFDETQILLRAFEDSFITISPNYFYFEDNGNTDNLFAKLGSIDEEGPSLVLIKGPQRSGKSTFAQQFTLEYSNSLYKAFDNHAGFREWWDETDFSQKKFFFLDNIYPIWDQLSSESYKDLVERSTKDRIIVVILLDSVEYHWIRLRSELKIFDQKPFEIPFKRASPSEIANIITKRAEAAGKVDYFNPEVLNAISIFSFGLPGLALWYTRNLISFQESQGEGKEITLSTAYRIAEYLGFTPALKIVEHNNLLQNEQVFNRGFWPILPSLKKAPQGEDSSLVQSLGNIKTVSKPQNPILEEMIMLTQENGTIKRSELQERTGVKESSLTYQCQNLVKEKIISYSKEGREVFYQLRSPVKEALELTFFG